MTVQERVARARQWLDANGYRLQVGGPHANMNLAGIEWFCAADAVLRAKTGLYGGTVPPECRGSAFAIIVGDGPDHAP